MSSREHLLKLSIKQIPVNLYSELNTSLVLFFSFSLFFLLSKHVDCLNLFSFFGYSRPMVRESNLKGMTMLKHKIFRLYKNYITELDFKTIS